MLQALLILCNDPGVLETRHVIGFNLAFKAERGYVPLYWELVRMAPEVKASRLEQVNRNRFVTVRWKDTREL